MRFHTEAFAKDQQSSNPTWAWPIDNEQFHNFIGVLFPSSNPLVPNEKDKYSIRSIPMISFEELESNLKIEKQRLQEWRDKKAKSIEKQDAEKIFADI